MVAAGTTTALIILRRKWERHRAKIGDLDESHFLERWGLFSMSTKLGKFKYPQTRTCNQLDTYPGGHNVCDDCGGSGSGKNGGADNDRKQKMGGWLCKISELSYIHIIS